MAFIGGSVVAAIQTYIFYLVLVYRTALLLHGKCIPITSQCHGPTQQPLQCQHIHKRLCVWVEKGIAGIHHTAGDWNCNLK